MNLNYIFNYLTYKKILFKTLILKYDDDIFVINNGYYYPTLTYLCDELSVICENQTYVFNNVYLQIYNTKNIYIIQ